MEGVLAWQRAAVVLAVCLFGFSAGANGAYPSIPGFTPCDYYPCGPDGTCELTKAAPFYSCKCLPGFQWDAATTRCMELDACNPNPCGPKGTCSMTGEGTYDCSCPTKYTVGYDNGKLTCIADSSVCDKNPCGPAGECMPVGAKDYACTCVSGFAQKGGKGPCLEISDPCAGNPCKGVSNTCVPLIGGGYRCQCGLAYFLPSKFKKAGGYCVLRVFRRLRKTRGGMRPKRGRGKYWKRGGKHRNKKKRGSALH